MSSGMPMVIEIEDEPAVDETIRGMGEVKDSTLIDVEAN